MACVKTLANGFCIWWRQMSDAESWGGQGKGPCKLRLQFIGALKVNPAKPSGFTLSCKDSSGLETHPSETQGGGWGLKLWSRVWFEEASNMTNCIYYLCDDSLSWMWPSSRQRICLKKLTVSTDLEGQGEKGKWKRVFCLQRYLGSSLPMGMNEEYR